MPSIDGQVGGDDFHCGWYEINVNQTVTITERKQSVCFGPFINNGSLIIDGQHIIEA